MTEKYLQRGVFLQSKTELPREEPFPGDVYHRISISVSEIRSNCVSDVGLEGDVSKLLLYGSLQAGLAVRAELQALEDCLI